MEKLNYKEIVEKVLENHAKNPSNSQTEVKLIFDPERERFFVLNIGWQDLTRIFGCIIYIEIKDGKIWIERDGTEIGVANELVEAGVPKQDIVLGFKAPYKRKFTDFAASLS
ncbi:XisI protein [Gloeothece citriformis PCC 7424]|uniref:XisI protein n=1 Tax=Gloeothece citriformis (strain PCC 7424) TaxID=65393 RepID=B7K8W4_GLOC7|nr:XisI protein [Gloeothece citriformis]ACK72733.1 XisI protein [Gloeothece citriformis PCC 7424]